MSAWTKVGLAAAVTSTLGAITATVWVGARVREETVVANPYEEGLRLTENGAGRAHGSERGACDVGAGPCTLPLEGGGEVTLELAPRPLRTMAELEVRVVLRAAPGERGEAGAGAEADEVVVSFSMAGMSMGKNEVRLAPADGASPLTLPSPPARATPTTTRAGTAILVRCPSGRKDWIAEVRVGPAGARARTARFALTVEE